MGNPKDEHVYYWAWQESDNPDYKHMSPGEPKWFRVFRLSAGMNVKDAAVTEPMTKAEAMKKCGQIVRLTGGREI